MTVPRSRHPSADAARAARQPLRSSALAIEPDERAAEAFRRVLDHLRTVVDGNAPGVLDDADPEFLHQLRVATRRARSALASLRGVLPEASAAALAEELSWLGSSSNACRDLDVHLASAGDLWADGVEVEGAEQAVARLGRSRTSAWKEAAEALRSPRFRRLMAAWRRLAEAPAGDDASAPDADRPIRSVVDERILAAHRRTLGRVRKLGRKGTPRAAHRLRIAGKRLRYLLELFRSLYPATALDPLLDDLKVLQDHLGAVQDTVVQRSLLEGLDLAADAPTNRVLDAARRSLGARQLRLWEDLAEPLGRLAASRSAYERLTSER